MRWPWRPSGRPSPGAEATAGAGGAAESVAGRGANTTDARPGQHEVVLVTRPGCHLCEVAAPVVARLAAEHGARWRTLPVDDDPQRVAAWGDLVPVVLVDGDPVCHWQVDEAAVAQALRP